MPGCKHRTQVDNVIELEVVTGDGRLLRCSADANSALFDAVRGGLGQFGVITEARIPLRKALPNVRTYTLTYEDAVSRLPAPVARTSRIMLGPFRGERLGAPLLMRPEGELLMGYGIITQAPPSELKEILPILANESRRIIDAGGKRYLSGWLNFDRQGWQEHYGEQWPRLLEWKQEFDPRHILNPDLIPLVE